MCVPFSVFCVLFVCKCVLYYCHRLSTQLQLNISSLSSSSSSSQYSADLLFLPPSKSQHLLSTTFWNIFGLFLPYRAMPIKFHSHTEYVWNSGLHKFSKNLNLPQNSRYQKDDVKQILYCGPNNIWHRHTKFCRHDDMTPGICAPLELTHIIVIIIINSNYCRHWNKILNGMHHNIIRRFRKGVHYIISNYLCLYGTHVNANLV
jgi:hypothetical protein